MQSVCVIFSHLLEKLLETSCSVGSLVTAHVWVSEESQLCTYEPGKMVIPKNIKGKLNVFCADRD